MSVFVFAHLRLTARGWPHSAQDLLRGDTGGRSEWPRRSPGSRGRTGHSPVGIRKNTQGHLRLTKETENSTKHTHTHTTKPAHRHTHTKHTQPKNTHTHTVQNTHTHTTESRAYSGGLTHIDVAQQVVEATVSVVGGAAEGFEDAQPLGTQGAAVGRQLGAQDANVIHPADGEHSVSTHTHTHTHTHIREKQPVSRLLSQLRRNQSSLSTDRSASLCLSSHSKRLQTCSSHGGPLPIHSAPQMESALKRGRLPSKGAFKSAKMHKICHFFGRTNCSAVTNVMSQGVIQGVWGRERYKEEEEERER